MTLPDTKSLNPTHSHTMPYAIKHRHTHTHTHTHTHWAVWFGSGFPELGILPCSCSSSRSEGAERDTVQAVAPGTLRPTGPVEPSGAIPLSPSLCLPLSPTSFTHSHSHTNTQRYIY